jgi:hypothetical protein
MIVTFTAFGVYFDKKFHEWTHTQWACSLALGGVAVVLALIVVFILLADAQNGPKKEINRVYGNI